MEKTPRFEVFQKPSPVSVPNFEGVSFFQRERVYRFTDRHTILSPLYNEHTKRNVAKMCDNVTKIGIIIKYFISKLLRLVENGNVRLYFLKVFNFKKKVN